MKKLSALVVLMFGVLQILADPPVQTRPVPAGPEQEKAEQLVKDVFKDDYAKKTQADKLALSAKLSEQARETKDDPVARFVLFREARDLAAQAGDLEQSLKIVDEVAKLYAVNTAELKVDVLEAASAAMTPATCKAFTDTATLVLDELLEKDGFEAAARLLKVSQKVCHAAKNVPLLTVLQSRETDVESRKKESEKAKTALESLSKNPKDAAASLIAGKYLCIKGDWEKGLPLLAAGGDAKLSELAKLDLALPVKAEDQAKTGDGWYTFATSEKHNLQLKQRAFYWYSQSVTAGITGLSKAKVEKRIAELEKSFPPELPKPFARWSFEKDAKDSVGTMHGTLIDGAVVVGGRLRCGGKGACMRVTLPKDIKERTFEVSVSLGALNHTGNVFDIWLKKSGSATWDGIAFTDRGKWWPGSSWKHRSRDLDGPQEITKPGGFVHMVVTYADDNSVAMYRNGEVYGSSFTPDGDNGTLRTYPAKEAYLRVGSCVASSSPFSCEVKEARLYDRALTAKEVANLYKFRRDK